MFITGTIDTAEKPLRSNPSPWFRSPFIGVRVVDETMVSRETIDTPSRSSQNRSRVGTGIRFTCSRWSDPLFVFESSTSRPGARCCDWTVLASRNERPSEERSEYPGQRTASKPGPSSYQLRSVPIRMRALSHPASAPGGHHPLGVHRQ